MSRRGRIVAAAAAVICAGVVLPSLASAHAYLIKTVPAASGVLDAPPPNVQLTYDEAVEPRFAIISVTSAAGRQETTGPVRRSRAGLDTLVVPLRPGLPHGWCPWSGRMLALRSYLGDQVAWSVIGARRCHRLPPRAPH